MMSEQEIPITDGFDFPVGKPDAKDYYVAAGLAEQEYYERFKAWHPGEDWNDLRGGDSDLGAPVYAVAHGLVVTVDSFRAWGNIVLIEHHLPDGNKVWSQYAHLEECFVEEGQVVQRGEQIGTIGKGAGDRYPAHLHFEIRLKSLPANKWGLTRDQVLRAYADPTHFIKSHRPGAERLEITVDDAEEVFVRSESEYWHEADYGYKGHTYWTWTVSEEQGEDCWAEWRPKLPQAGLYEVFAFVPRRYATTRSARYQITHRRGVDVVTVDQSQYYDEWVSLGAYAFSIVQPAYVRLGDVTGEPYTRDESQRKQIAFDAVMWVLGQPEED
jgi:murein DD-endopeptidase MepM/ murein hydrolase activator NlpD